MATMIRINTQRPSRAYGIGGSVGPEAMAMAAGAMNLQRPELMSIGGSATESVAQASGVLLVRNVVVSQPELNLTQPEQNDDDILQTIGAIAVSEETELATV